MSHPVFLMCCIYIYIYIHNIYMYMYIVMLAKSTFSAAHIYQEEAERLTSDQSQEVRAVFRRFQRGDQLINPILISWLILMIPRGFHISAQPRAGLFPNPKLSMNLHETHREAGSSWAEHLKITSKRVPLRIFRHVLKRWLACTCSRWFDLLLIGENWTHFCLHILMVQSLYIAWLFGDFPILVPSLPICS